MSIYISGVEMPTEGNETIIRILPDGTVLDQYGHHLGLKALFVPEHGRLIDADDFFSSFPELRPYEFIAPTIIPADPPKEET